MPGFCEFEEPRTFTDAQQKRNTGIRFQTDNYFLTKFLRYRDWNVEAAYKSIVSYYQLELKAKSIFKKEFRNSIHNLIDIQHDNPLVHADKNISDYMDLLNMNTRVLIDKRDRNGRIVFVAKLGIFVKLFGKKLTFELLIRYFMIGSYLQT